MINIDADLIATHFDTYAEEEGIRYDGVNAEIKPKWKLLKRKRAPVTVNRMRTALSSVMNFAIQRRYIRGKSCDVGSNETRKQSHHTIA